MKLLFVTTSCDSTEYKYPGGMSCVGGWARASAFRRFGTFLRSGAEPSYGWRKCTFLVLRLPAAGGFFKVRVA